MTNKNVFQNFNLTIKKTQKKTTLRCYFAYQIGKGF